MLEDIKSTILCEEDKDFKYHKRIGNHHPCELHGLDCKFLTFTCFLGDGNTNLKIKGTPFIHAHKISEDVLVLNIPFSNNYGHILHDVIPKLLILDQQSEYDRVIMFQNQLLKKILAVLKIKFSRKIHFINKAFDFNCSKITYRSDPAYHVRCIDSTRLFKAHIEEVIKNNITTTKRNRLIYYKREGKDVRHSRSMDYQNEKEIINLLKNYSDKNNLDFTVFNGLKNGETMPFIEQIRLFREASVAVGPHGSGLANTIWMDPHNNCRVCEFCSGSKNIIHGSSGYIKNYNFLYGGMVGDYIDYNLIPFRKESTKDITHININNLKKFLTW